MVSVINGYSYFDDVLYMVTLSEDGSQMLRCVEVKPVFKKEKLEYVPMTAVVNTKWYSPKRGDPFRNKYAGAYRTKTVSSHSLSIYVLSTLSSLRLDKCISTMWTQSRTLMR